MSDLRTPISDYDFELPDELIAQHPPKDRGTSRLLVVGDGFQDRSFTEIADFLDRDSFLVVNSTKVMKARMYGTKPTGGQVEILVLEKISANTCTAITKGKVKEGTQINIGEYKAIVKEILNDGSRFIEFIGINISDAMERYGHMPLPPYITREDTERDKERYQTVYSKDEGSVAAPTAGLHFTPEILQAVKDKGVPVLEVTLNIGIGTFRPVKADFLEDHDMHTEKFYIAEETAEEINRLKVYGKRLVAVGTTAVRALESASKDGKVKSGYGETDLFIKPGYRFKVTDSLITNFHLPKSTLFVLVSQLAGREKALAAYEHAKAKRYRFFSYGDAMLITGSPADREGRRHHSE